MARPLLRRGPEASLRPVSVAAFAALEVALVAVPVYLDIATAQFALRSAFDAGAIVPLLSASAFGRGWLEMELVLALILVAGALALVLDRPRRPVRSVAGVLALIGVLGTAAAALLVPGLAGTPRRSPRAGSRSRLTGGVGCIS